MSAETWWIVGCVVVGVIGLWLVLRGRRTEVVGGDHKRTSHTKRAPASAPKRRKAKGLPALDEHVRKLAAEGKKIEAIKTVREHTGLGLKEAKDYVEAIPNVVPLAQMMQPPTAAAVVAAEPASGGDPRQEAIALVAQGNSIAAIKLVRERMGLGLAEAKSYIDGLQVPSRETGLHAMFAAASLDDLANSTTFRGVLDRALKRGMPEDQIVADLVRTTGRSEADLRALIARARGARQSPIQ